MALPCSSYVHEHFYILHIRYSVYPPMPDHAIMVGREVGIVRQECFHWKHIIYRSSENFFFNCIALCDPRILLCYGILSVLYYVLISNKILFDDELISYLKLFVFIRIDR
jgi:hypothetical protein